MSASESLIAAAEASVRANSGIVLDCLIGSISDSSRFEPGATEDMLATCSRSLVREQHVTLGASEREWARTHGATYAYDGSLEGMFSAIYAAFCARDGGADILCERDLQPRLGQEVVVVPTNLDDALKVRRLVEYSLGTQAFRCIRAATASEEPGKGTIVYRFLRHALRESGRRGCNSCVKKATCTRACESPATCSLLDDLSQPEVLDLMSLYRSVMNERHLMVQFIRFEHCEGDVWYARCNPKASVVPLLMDWFIPRFNDQEFVIYDENHAISGVYDGRRWYLVGGDAVTPPPHMDDERMMQEAWRRFYRSLSVDARYNPELRRSFMPMRLWRNLPELR